METLYTSETIKAIYSGQRIVYQGARIATPFNQQLEVGDYGTVQQVQDGTVYVAFDRGLRMPLTEESDAFVCL
jgi:hypothetical protein